ncbi:MAG: DegQ family serine endoprotease [Candidatus Marinimicrobia bacterium]|nr:DegQ family serine endoprotease [Candidatus Neomarinimicrobiota bacterium]
MRKELSISIFVFFALAFGQHSIVDQFSQAFADVAEKANPAVVTIKAEKTIQMDQVHPQFDQNMFPFFQFPKEYNSNALGSGVIVDKDKGYILTNNHVVENADEIKIVLMDKREIEAEIIGTDPKSDLAILKIDAKNLSELELGNSDNVRVGEWVLAVGSPFSSNLSHTVTAGIVSALGRSNIISNQHYEDFIQTDAAINPGNSGGALLNMKGELIGINTAIATGGVERANRGVGFAIPSNMIKKVMDDLINHGYVVRAWLGVYIQPIDQKMAKVLDLDFLDGALVNDIVKDSPAEKAGIKKGDVIIEFEGEKVKDPSHLKNVVSVTRPETKSNVVVYRDGKKKTIFVTLEELENEPQVFAARSSNDQNYGMQVQDISPSIADHYNLNNTDNGVVVTEIIPGGHADKSGIMVGDVISRIGKKDVTSVREFRQLIKSSEKDDTVLFLVKRDGISRFYAVDQND